MNTFAKAVLDKLNELGWKNADLAREAGITTGALSNILNGHRVPEPMTILSIARALKEPPIKYFRLMGWLPYEADKAEDEEEMLYLFRQLPKVYKIFVLQMLRGAQGQTQQHGAQDEQSPVDIVDLMLKLYEVEPERIKQTTIYLERKLDGAGGSGV